MVAASFPLIVSYAQVAVFDRDLAQPFNTWTAKHVEQGFSWRPGSVSFATIEEAGQHDVEVDVIPGHVDLPSDAMRVIQTPFAVPRAGAIEIASISGGVTLDLPPGNYALRFLYFLPIANSPPRILFQFIRTNNSTFAIIRADAKLSVTNDLLLAASPPSVPL